MLNSLAIEDQLLLESCRAVITADGAERAAELIERGPDWGYVLEASIRHAVAPLLKHGLDQIRRMEDVEGKVPDVIFHDLQELYQGSARRNARLFDALREVTQALRAAGVDPVGLKDVQLAVDVYPDPALRPMGDIDLLIRRDDWDVAARSLTSLGFLPRPSADVPYTRRYAPAQHFRRAADEIWIDLQWNVLQREWDLDGEGSFTYDGAAMWRNAAPVEGLDFELRAPSLEDMLFHLCLHLEGHLYCELVLFCDIAELLRREVARIRWDVLSAIARRYKAESSLYYVFLLVERLLGAPVPAAALEALNSPFFHGGLLAPVYGNLAVLHLTLDEIRLAAAPPRKVMDECERVARRQAARAMRLDAELTGLVGSFVRGGGALAVVDGRSSLRLFPDAALPAFEPIRLLVLTSDSPLLEQAIAERGFTVEPSAERAVSKTVRVSSGDPALTGQVTSLTLEIEWSSDLTTLLARADGRTNAGSAIRSLRQRLLRAGPNDATATVRLLVFALRPEELIVGLAADVGFAREDRLFRACSLVELLRKLPTAPDWQLVAGLAADHGVEGQVASGLAVAAALTDAARTETTGTSSARALEWARYGPESVNRYPWLRAAYYFALSLLAADGAKGKLAYLGRALIGGRESRPVLPSIALAAGKGIIGSIAGGRPSLRDFAYWVEPATAERLAPHTANLIVHGTADAP